MMATDVIVGIRNRANGTSNKSAGVLIFSVTLSVPFLLALITPANHKIKVRYTSVNDILYQAFDGMNIGAETR